MSSDASVIPVYILTTDTQSPDLTRLMNKFSDGTFIRMPVTIDFPQGSTTHLKEYNRLMKSLEMAENDYPNSSNIIVKDNMMTFHSPENVAKILKSVNDHNNDDSWDLFYLGKWLDKCELYDSPQRVTSDTVRVRTYAPQGFQAIMFSPSGRKRVLSSMPTRNSKAALNLSPNQNVSESLTGAIANNRLIARCTPQSLFHPDPTKLNGEWYKLNDCLPPGQNAMAMQGNMQGSAMLQPNLQGNLQPNPQGNMVPAYPLQQANAHNNSLGNAAGAVGNATGAAVGAVAGAVGAVASGAAAGANNAANAVGLQPGVQPAFQPNGHPVTANGVKVTPNSGYTSNTGMALFWFIVIIIIILFAIWYYRKHKKAAVNIN